MFTYPQAFIIDIDFICLVVIVGTLVQDLLKMSSLASISDPKAYHILTYGGYFDGLKRLLRSQAPSVRRAVLVRHIS